MSIWNTAVPMWAVALAVAAGTGGSAGASPITDPVGDFLPTYTGPKNPALDVIRASVTFDGSRFILEAKMGGPINPAAVGTAWSYVWGFDRGAGTERFVGGNPSVGQGVKFDSVVVINPNGTGAIARLAGPAGTGTLSDIVVDGDTIRASAPLSALPGLGFAPWDYTWNLWPRSGGGNAAISDFAPDASNAPVANPEPASLLVFGALGLTAVGLRAFARKGVRVT